MNVLAHAWVIVAWLFIIAALVAVARERQHVTRDAISPQCRGGHYMAKQSAGATWACVRCDATAPSPVRVARAAIR